MTSAAPSNDNWHLSLSIRKELWDHLLGAALPVKLASGAFDAVKDLRRVVRSLEVKERVQGLLEDRSPPEMVVRAQKRAVSIWHDRKDQVKALVEDLVRVSGEWKVQIERDGSEFRYGQQELGLQATIKLLMEGQAVLLSESVQLPFTLEKQAAAALNLRNIRFDREQGALVGDLEGFTVDLGEHVLLQLLGRVAEMAMEKQLPRVSPLRILARDQIEQLVGPMGGSLKLNMGVEELALDVDEDNVTLKVRFGFTQRQIEGA